MARRTSPPPLVSLSFQKTEKLEGYNSLKMAEEHQDSVMAKICNWKEKTKKKNGFTFVDY